MGLVCPSEGIKNIIMKSIKDVNFKMCVQQALDEQQDAASFKREIMDLLKNEKIKSEEDADVKKHQASLQKIADLLHTVNRFCDLLDQKLSDFPDHALVYCVDNMPRSVTNAAFLLGSYMVLKMRLSPEAVWSSFEDISGHRHTGTPRSRKQTSISHSSTAGADFHVQIPSAGCSPTIWRSTCTTTRPLRETFTS